MSQDKKRTPAIEEDHQNKRKQSSHPPEKNRDDNEESMHPEQKNWEVCFHFFLKLSLFCIFHCFVFVISARLSTSPISLWESYLINLLNIFL
jgi:hypothetical protein